MSTHKHWTHLDFSKLALGDAFVLGSKRYHVVKVTSDVLVLDLDGKKVRMNVLNKGWDQFVRDAESLVLASVHGVVGGEALLKCRVGDRND